MAMAPRSSITSDDGLRPALLPFGIELAAMFRRIAAGLGGLLVLFHLWLFGSQLWEGQLAELGPVLRWAMAAGLTAALVGLYRSGGSVVRGRKAVAIWLLAALLHAPAIAGDSQAPPSPALAEAVTVLVQITAASAALGLGLALLALVLRRVPARRLARARAVARRRVRPNDPGRSLHVTPRPPPSFAVPALL
jgi:hypothetical protein